MTILIEIETLRTVLQEELRPMKESIQRLEEDSKDTRKKVKPDIRRYGETGVPILQSKLALPDTRPRKRNLVN